MDTKADFNAVVVGLGLIGGSAAYNLKKQTSGFVCGIDKDESVLKLAQEKGAITLSACSLDGIKFALAHADFVFLCLYPNDNIEFVKEHIDNFKDGVVITDVSGIKENICEVLNTLSDKITFIGGHPMAGKEEGGFANASCDLFNGCYYILTPPEDANIIAFSSLSKIIENFGVGEIVTTTPSKHDKQISLTSTLPHIIATAVCNIDDVVGTTGFTAGSFSDITRVAKINSTLWSELFIGNKYVADTIEDLIKELETVKHLIVTEDREKLTQYLDKAKAVKDNLY